ncbi:peptidylprolyl isomerase [Pseudoalteromonas spongiae]|uniref:peptidylprolyl isomerase n=1 Tax=Pseudoalteromonas spongiae TaxID=298657 RepID=UPI000C2D07E5|nr:peptidylprolyl isomerase [Pseudoalteromonas spongiae]
MKIRKHNKFLTLFLVNVALIGGCSDKPKSVATVGDQGVTQQELNAYYELKRIDKDNAELVTKAKKHYLESLAVSQAIESLPEFDTSKLAVELNEIKKDLLLSRYLNQFLETAVTDVEMRNYYAQNSDKYQSKQAKVSHILIRVAQTDDQATRQAKYSKAQEAYSKVITGQAFADVALAMSEDKVSAKNGGQLGWIKEGAVAPTFSDAVFNQLKEQQISQPILTSFGYHIIKLEHTPKTVSQPYEHVKGNIKRTLRKAAKDTELARLKSTVSVTL